jgi:hypothetical protein
MLVACVVGSVILSVAIGRMMRARPALVPVPVKHATAQGVQGVDQLSDC